MNRFHPRLENLGDRITPAYAVLYAVADADGGGLIEVDYTDDGVASDPVFLDPLGQPILRFDGPPAPTPIIPADPPRVVYAAKAGTDNGNGGTGGTAITVAGTLAFVVSLNNTMPPVGE